MKRHSTDASAGVTSGNIEPKTIKKIPNKPEPTADEQVRIRVFRAMLHAGEMMHANTSLEKCYIAIGSHNGDLHVSVSDPREQDASTPVFEYLRPFNGFDLRGLTDEEINKMFDKDRFTRPTPKLIRPNPENQVEALVKWVSGFSGVDYIAPEDRPRVEIPQWRIDADQRYSAQAVLERHAEREAESQASEPVKPKLGNHVDRDSSRNKPKEIVDVVVPILNGNGSNGNGNGAHPKNTEVSPPSELAV